jgi:SCY1-like protein 1
VSVGSDGWAVHEGSRKSDGAPVTVFVAKKPAMAKTPADRSRNPQFSQLGAAIHHYQYAKRLRHPQILQVLALLDTDNPSDDGSSAGGAGHHHHNQQHPSASSSSKETGDLIIVTEPCVPLESWLAPAGAGGSSNTNNSKPTQEQVAWGLESAVRALHFLHSSANLSHGNVSPASLFVTRAGDVKLWNFSLVTPVADGLSLHFKDYEALLTPQQFRSPERIESRWNDIATGGVHVMDSYSVGVLIPTLFGGVSPPLLQKAVQRMMTPNVKMRPRLQPLLKCPIFNTPYQSLQLQLEELAIQPVEQKISFWHNLTGMLQQPTATGAGLIVPESLAVHKLLPIVQSAIRTIADSESLRAQDMYRRERTCRVLCVCSTSVSARIDIILTLPWRYVGALSVLALLPPFFFILERHLGADKATAGSARNVDTIASLFRVNDRGIRGSLLQKMHYLTQIMDANALNNQVFEPMCSGFSDSSSALRELTLKATLSLVPHMTQPNLEKLSRYLVRLQSDPEASIRTNTVIFFSKLAPHLTETTRQKQLLPAFVRALKDPFTPCRLSALKSVLQAKEFFTPVAIATSVLPVVTPQLLDPVAEVRREAFLVVDDLIFFLRQESERMPASAAAGDGSQPGPAGARHAPSPSSAPAPPLPSAVAPAPASGGYLSGLSSWVTSAAAAPIAPPPSSHLPPSTAAGTAAAPQPHVNAMHVTSAHLSALTLQDSGGGWGDSNGSGWDDPDDDDNDDFMGEGSARTHGSGGTGLSAPAVGGSLFTTPAQTEDDLFGSMMPGAAAARKPAGVQARANKGKLAVPAAAAKASSASSPATKPSVTKLDMDDDDDPAGHGWDDF